MKSPTGSTATNLPASFDVRKGVIICSSNLEKFTAKRRAIRFEKDGKGRGFITIAAKVLAAVINTERATFPLEHN